jgi:putative endonuclease
MGEKLAFAYVLKSLKDGKYYYGSTDDIETRLRAHNAGKVRSTKARRPLVVHYKEEYKTKHEARLREFFFKTIEGHNWLKTNKII